METRLPGALPTLALVVASAWGCSGPSVGPMPDASPDAQSARDGGTDAAPPVVGWVDVDLLPSEPFPPAPAHCRETSVEVDAPIGRTDRGVVQQNGPGQPDNLWTWGRDHYLHAFDSADDDLRVRSVLSEYIRPRIWLLSPGTEGQLRFIGRDGSLHSQETPEMTFFGGHRWVIDALHPDMRPSSPSGVMAVVDDTLYARWDGVFRACTLDGDCRDLGPAPVEPEHPWMLPVFASDDSFVWASERSIWRTRSSDGTTLAIVRDVDPRQLAVRAPLIAWVDQDGALFVLDESEGEIQQIAAGLPMPDVTESDGVVFSNSLLDVLEIDASAVYWVEDGRLRAYDPRRGVRRPLPDVEGEVRWLRQSECAWYLSVSRAFEGGPLEIIARMPR